MATSAAATTTNRLARVVIALTVRLSPKFSDVLGIACHRGSPCKPFSLKGKPKSRLRTPKRQTRHPPPDPSKVREQLHQDGQRGGYRDGRPCSRRRWPSAEAVSTQAAGDRGTATQFRLEVKKHLPHANSGSRFVADERTAKANVLEPRRVRRPIHKSTARAAASGHLRTEAIYRWALPLSALARLAHPKPPLVRGAAEVARPALAAEPLTISTYCPPASKVGCVAGDQSGRSGEAGRAPDLGFGAEVSTP